MPRILVRSLVAACTLLALAPTGLRAQDAAPTVVYLVRHAETEPGSPKDPPLSEAGLHRADRLARMLAGVDLTAVHATSYRRTRETAARVAETVGLPVLEYDPSELRAFAAHLLEQGGRPLVVGHSNTTPALVQLLGGDPAGPIAGDEYGRMYVVTVDEDAVRTLVTGYPGGYLADPPPARAAAPAPLPTEDYIRSSGPVIERIGFQETEVARRVERFGDVAHAFSTYEGYQEGREEPVMSGLNSIQLIHDGARWWVSSLAWAPARPDLPIPPRYQPDDDG